MLRLVPVALAKDQGLGQHSIHFVTFLLRQPVVLVVSIGRFYGAASYKNWKGKIQNREPDSLEQVLAYLG